MDESFTQMRNFIIVTEDLVRSEFEQPTLIEDVQPEHPPQNFQLLDELHSVLFKLRAFTESSEGDYALGVEMGMQRAADMIENAINHTKESK